jgi:hypothetical protein
MRHARILDVLSAVTAVAAAHPEVEAWWYAPPRRLRLQGEIARAGAEVPSLEVIVQVAPSSCTDCDKIASELSQRLPGSPVAVRLHRAEAEERQLFRLLSVSRRPRGGAEERAGGPAAGESACGLAASETT